MKNNRVPKDRLYNRVYDYSKRYLSFKRKFTKLLIKIVLNLLFGILIYFSIIFYKDNPDKVLLSLFIAGVIIADFLVNLALEDSEIKKLRRQEKTYARTFILLNNDYRLAQRDIKSRDEFLSIVSHELKTPLTTMLLKLHNELNNIQNASLANFSVHELLLVLKNSEQQIKWLKSMINDLVDVSLITTGRINLQLEDADLVNITKQVNMSFSEVLKRKKYKVKINAEGPVIGKWDKARLEQVITNLFSNAVKYGEGKQIDVQVIKHRNKGKFIIKDSGIGISSGEQKVIFDLFKRTPGSEKYKQGLGVGLFIASQIIKIHGGNIKVSSSLNKGTSFIVELPLNK